MDIQGYVVFPGRDAAILGVLMSINMVLRIVLHLLVVASRIFSLDLIFQFIHSLLFLLCFDGFA
jgi:hypothetical protein